MPNIYQSLPRPFFVLAPMDDVTDTVFRRVIAGTAAPDLFFTEFVSVDGLQSVGRANLLRRIQFTDKETPIIAQIWGKNPENYYKTAKELVEMGFAGVDINMGCPVKTVIKNGCCSALINNRDLALEIIQATQEGVRAASHTVPVSVKTRLGFAEVDLSWHELLLKQNLQALTIHGRTAKNMSDVPANWEVIGEIARLRDKLSPGTFMIGNGDVLAKQRGRELAEKHKIDGIMIGRGIFQDPYVFADKSPWPEFTREQRIELFRKHVLLFAETWKNDEHRLHVLNKFCKIYIQKFDGAKDLRETLMNTNNVQDLMGSLK